MQAHLLTGKDHTDHRRRHWSQVPEGLLADLGSRDSIRCLSSRSLDDQSSAHSVQPNRRTSDEHGPIFAYSRVVQTAFVSRITAPAVRCA